MAAAGGLGAVARFALGVLPFTGETFPWGTLVVNVLGCLLFGLLFPLVERHAWPPGLRLAVFVGFLGAFTTFSTFAHETAVLGREHGLVAAAGNPAVQNLLGLAAVVSGHLAGSRLFAG